MPQGQPCSCGSPPGKYTDDCPECRGRALRAQAARDRRARGREARLRLPAAQAEEIQAHIETIRQAETDYNTVRRTGSDTTPREAAAALGLGAALEIADLLEELMAPLPRRMRARRGSSKD